MALYVFYHFGPIVVLFDQGISFPDAKMPNVVMHLLEDGFYKGFRDDHGFILLAVLPVYVVYTDHHHHHTHKNPFHETYS